VRARWQLIATGCNPVSMELEYSARRILSALSAVDAFSGSTERLRL
jgi:hypothetical protein